MTFVSDFHSNPSVRLHQMRICQGNVRANVQRMVDLYLKACADSLSLAVFPAWALTGLVSDADLLDGALFAAQEEAIHELMELTRKSNTALLFGVVREVNGVFAESVVALEKGRFLNPPKGPLFRLPSSENRFDSFVPSMDALRMAYACGEDPEARFAPIPFSFGPVAVWLGEKTPAVFATGEETLLRIRLTSRPYQLHRASTEGAPVSAGMVLTCGGVGCVDTGKTLFVLEGGTGYSKKGMQKRLPPLEESHFDWTGEEISLPLSEEKSTMDTLIQALETGVRTELARLSLSRVVIGASGGIDSALTAAVYRRVLPPDSILLVNMPSRHNSQTTISLARQLAEAMGCCYMEIPIEESLALTVRQIDGACCKELGRGRDVRLTLSPLAVENVQARDRSGRILSALSSAFGGVFTCNANKSETTIGYGTLYGDISGYFAALADLWKCEVWDLARYYNREIFSSPLIPQGSIDLIPSAELSAAQDVDAGKGDPLVYPYHDRLFAAWTERERPVGPRQLLQWYRENVLSREIGYDGDLARLFPTEERFVADLKRYWNLYSGLARAKRLQAPPVLSLKNRTFGFDLAVSQLPVRWGIL